MTQKKLPVYRTLKGKLVRIPGDIRDPKRRYKHVSNAQTGESYLQEFTDEEESQRDAEEAAWEAQRPQREAEANRREEEARRFRESLRYESRIVAFLDILGWAQAIGTSAASVERTQKLGIAMQGLNAHVEMTSRLREHGGSEGWPGDPMMTHFSDSLLISFSADRYAKNYLEMVLSSVIQGLFLNGFVVRGAVSCGPLIHRESLSYGPALITAYRLEQDKALFPRIILDLPLAKAWGQGERIQDRNGSLIGYRKIWRQDRDGWFFFDYLSYPYDMLVTERNEPRPIFRAMMAKWRELIIQRLAEYRECSSVRKKYVWMAHYFDQICSENLREDIKKIRLSD